MGVSAGLPEVGALSDPALLRTEFAAQESGRLEVDDQIPVRAREVAISQSIAANLRAVFRRVVDDVVDGIDITAGQLEPVAIGVVGMSRRVVVNDSPALSSWRVEADIVCVGNRP